MREVSNCRGPRTYHADWARDISIVHDFWPLLGSGHWGALEGRFAGKKECGRLKISSRKALINTEILAKYRLEPVRLPGF